MIKAPFRVAHADLIGLLERVGTQVEDFRHAQEYKRLLPYVEAMRPLLGEDYLVIVVTNIQQIAGVGEVEKLLSRWVFSLSLDVGQEVVAVEVNLV